MIWQPRVGQRVILRFNPRLRREAIHIGNLHGQHGCVRIVATSTILKNARVELDSGESVTVPRGNLFKEAR